MRVLLDTNVVLDFFLEREPFFQEANAVFEAIVAEHLEGFITASSVTDIFYICRRQTQSIVEAKQIITRVLAILGICPIDRTNLETALNSSMTDFEDAVQLACAVQQQLDAIVTRNSQDFQALLNTDMIYPHPQPFSLRRREQEFLFPLHWGEG